MTLAASEADVRRWHASLQHRPALLARLQQDRGWSYPILSELEIGVGAGGRLTIPIRDHAGGLREILRYDPWRTHEPKMLAVRGTRLGLIPHPASEPSRSVLRVEGPPDMLAARARGLPAIAVPGTHAWRPEWAQLLNGRQVTVVMDCDFPGREAALRIAADLSDRGAVRVLDLDPQRDNGYDLTDALLEHAEHTLAAIRQTPGRTAPSKATSEADRGLER
jgi:Toprim-like